MCKKCTRCLTEKPLTEFYNKKSGACGKDSHCKPCRDAYNKEAALGLPHPPVNKPASRRLSRAERTSKQRLRFLANPRTEKKCGACKVTMSATDFYSNRYSPDGLNTYCKECAKAYKRREYSANPDPIREQKRTQRATPEYLEWQRAYLREWRKANPTKAAEYTNRRNRRKEDNGGSHTAEEFKSLCEHYGNRCLCCREAKPLIADHVIPVVKGGTSDISNIQPLCKQCNQRKNVHIRDYRRS